MNHKFAPVAAAVLIIGILLGVNPLAYGQEALGFGPKLEVVTIPQDDQRLAKGIIILGVDPSGEAVTPTASDLVSQLKIAVTYNGQTLTWAAGSEGLAVVCNVLQKDNIAVEADPKTGDGKQGSWENLMTKLVNVSDMFVCKIRWVSPAEGTLESVGVLDVYYVGPLPKAPSNESPGVTGTSVGVWIADNILVVEAFLTVGKTVVFGSDIQDICVLGWPIDATDAATSTNPMGGFVSCEDLALAQRAILGLVPPPGQDSQA